MDRAREKAEEVTEKTGEVISKGWGKAKGLGKSLKKELLCVHRKREGSKMSDARGSRRKQRKRK